MNRLALHWQILIGMIVGAAIGITLNVSVGEREVTVDEDDLPAGLSSLEISDSPSLITMSFVREDETDVTEVVVDGTRQTKGAFTTVEQMAKEMPD